MQSHCLNAQISQDFSVPPVPYLCKSVCPNISLCSVNRCEMPSSQSLSEVRVVLVSPQLVAGQINVCHVQAAILGGRQMDSVLSNQSGQHQVPAGQYQFFLLHIIKMSTVSFQFVQGIINFGQSLFNTQSCKSCRWILIPAFFHQLGQRG